MVYAVPLKLPVRPLQLNFLNTVATHALEFLLIVAIRSIPLSPPFVPAMAIFQILLSQILIVMQPMATWEKLRMPLQSKHLFYREHWDLMLGSALLTLPTCACHVELKDRERSCSSPGARPSSLFQLWHSAPQHVLAAAHSPESVLT